MTVLELAGLLGRLDPEFSHEDLRDMLWLAPHLDPPGRRSRNRGRPSRRPGEGPRPASGPSQSS